MLVSTCTPCQGRKLLSLNLTASLLCPNTIDQSHAKAEQQAGHLFPQQPDTLNCIHHLISCKQVQGIVAESHLYCKYLYTPSPFFDRMNPNTKPKITACHLTSIELPFTACPMHPLKSIQSQIPHHTHAIGTEMTWNLALC